MEPCPLLPTRLLAGVGGVVDSLGVVGLGREVSTGLWDSWDVMVLGREV